MQRIGRIVWVTLIFLAGALGAIAQPANNNFSAAIPLTGRLVETNGTTALAGKEPGEPNHAGNQGGRSVWYTWTPEKSGQTVIYLADSTFNPLLAVYTGGAVNALTAVASSQNGFVQFNVVGGTTYRIAVDTLRFFGNPNGGDFTLVVVVLASVNFLSPPSNSVVYVGSPMELVVDAEVLNPPVQQVDLYRGNSLLGSDSDAPYSFAIEQPLLGTNSFTAVAVDAGGQSWTSAVHRVIYLNPGATIVSPAEGTIFQNLNPVTVSAIASVPAGAVTNVEFHVDGLRFGTDGAAPFSATWSNVVGGVHRLTAVSRDNLGNVYTSLPVSISAPLMLVSTGAVWKYLDNGSDQGTNWTAINFNDSSWASGPAQLGYGDGDEATVVSFGAVADEKPITTYFRRSFTLTGATNYTNMIFGVKRDDGAVVYVNGAEVARFNMPSGVINYQTPGTAAGDDGTVFYPATVPATRLVDGVNVVAVEIHNDSISGDDISFDLQLLGGLYPRNQPAIVAVTSPAPEAALVAPASVTLTATATDPDGQVVRVSFYDGEVLLGETTASPYGFVWNNPPAGRHLIRAIAVDNLGTGSPSEVVPVNIFGAAGAPITRIITPGDGTVVEGPITLPVAAEANALSSVTAVELRANDVVFATFTQPPYAASWNAPFGTNAVTAVAVDAQGRRGTSAVATVTITIPPTNTVAPTIATRIPAANGTVSTLTQVRVTFSERVQGLDAADLLVNGQPALSVTNAGNLYLFTIAQPVPGTVTFSWAAGHGISDFGYPSPLPFDETAPAAGWTCNFVDRTPPTLATVSPAPGALLTNLSAVSVTFSESVAGVDPADFLINGTPAFAVSGAGASYTFSFSQPASGPVNLTFATGSGIVDLAAVPNAFAGTNWAYTLDARMILSQSNALWRLFKGRAEGSVPVASWRGAAFDDSTWDDSPAPFYFGDPYGSAANPGTLLNDMAGDYSTIYLRRQFTVPDAGTLTNLLLAAQADDGFIAWINGVEVARVNAPAGDVPYNGTATAAANEPSGAGAAYVTHTLPNPALYLADGVNTLAIHALNQTVNSSDFGFNAQLFTYLSDPKLVAPRLTTVSPAAGTVFYLTNLTLRFSEPVTGVNATDLRINGAPATGLTGAPSNTLYTFSFAQPPFGTVNVSWAADDDIVDFDAPPKPFDGTMAGSTFQYTFLNPSTPTILSHTPAPGTVNELTQIVVLFSEPVTGLDAADLLVNGEPAAALGGSGANYTFSFPQPAYGPVAITWAAGHGIRDLDVPSNAFDLARQGSLWNYTLVDQTPPAIVSVVPARGTQVTNLTQITLAFSEPVAGVNATDLRINGVGATSVAGGPTTFTFTFPQPNATVVDVSWLNAHGIRDLAPVPNSFDATGPGATWSYSTPDNVAPTVANIDPAPSITVRSLSSIRVTFTEVVTGVDAADLLINGQPPLSVSGFGAGPYTFNFLPPSNGVVQVRWVDNPGIGDLAVPAPNPFPGGQWSYVVNPDATFAGKVLINEIMFNPIGGRPEEEWIELRNVTASPINLAGWRFTRGVDFTFPNVTIPAAGYLVVAADVATFQAQHPEVTAVVGGWSGRLANSDENVELETALGESVNSIHYATEGDWGQRLRGRGVQLVESITRNGATATVNLFNHGFVNGDTIYLSGAAQPEYNGQFTISSVGGASFTITVAGSPVSPATGRILCHHVTHRGASGWGWFSLADGLGHSLELLNADLGNDSGQNWKPGTNLGGTPGAVNSVISGNVAPLVLDVAHFPPVPKSTDTVSITARIRDEQPLSATTVTLFHRDHTSAGPGGFSSVVMRDDGAHGDGLAGDGVFGAQLPPAANGTVVEFYVRAADSTGNNRTWPAPVMAPNGTFEQAANAVFQVDDEDVTNPMPALRVIMTGTERAAFPPSDRNSDAEANNTFISMDGDGTKVRYLCGVRVRGAGSRSQTPPNNRLNIPNDNRWNDLSGINLNGLYVHSQIMGAAVSRKAGLLSSDGRIIQYRINGVNPARLTAPGGGSGSGYGAFIMLLPVNGDLMANLYPDDGDGNVYRASIFPHDADLSYQGTNPVSYLTRGYRKASNGTENDWTDMFALTFAFSQSSAPLQDYIQTLSTNINVEMWMRYFAVGTLTCYGETAMFNGRGDDYALYRGIKDPRFSPIGHDFDTIFGQGDTTGSFTTTTNNQGNPTLFMMLNPPNTGGNAPNMPLLRRLMTNEVFAPVYFGELLRLCDTAFHPDQLNPLFDQMLSGWGNGPTTVTIDAMKTFANNRRRVVLSLIPTNLTVGTSLNVANGYLTATGPGATLFGASHAVHTRKVLVNGVEAVRSPGEARWTNTVALFPGINRVLVQSIDSNGVEFARQSVDIRYDNGASQLVSGTLGADAVWTAAGGPYEVTASLTVASGVTLTIQPGASVLLRPGVDLVVANGGRLLAEGTDTARIRFASVPGSGNWGGITIHGAASSPESRFSYVHIEGNGDTAMEVADGTVWLDHLSFGNTARQYLSLDRASFIVQNCYFPPTTASFEPTHGTGGIKAGGRGIFTRNFWGRIQGYNDSLDFTGGNRPGPILQVINNVFMGSDDDLLDLDSTDAWVERNIFLHTHRNGSPDSSSAVSGGADNADTSQITIVGNLFFDVDHAANAKQGNFYTMVNNTIVHQTRVGSQDTNTAVVILADDGTAQGAGMHLEGNIILDAENLTRNVTTAVVTYTNNIIHQLTGAPWTGLGGGNRNVDPLLKKIPAFAETTGFTSWESAQVLWDWFSLQPGSPARNAGPNGRDQGGVIPVGVSITGEPAETTSLNAATLLVGLNRTDGVPTNGFASGSGYTHYRWRLDGGAWSAETPGNTPITLTALANGPHFVEAVGRRDSGFYQDDPAFSADSVVTVSRTWTVNTSRSPLRLNEILAANSGVLVHEGRTPDAIELFNESGSAVNLAGVRLTDDLTAPDKFIFPAGASIPAGGYLTVYAGSANGASGFHTGFTLAQEGQSLHLIDAATRGGAVIDSITFGLQVTDLSIGRGVDGSWGLTAPTFGAANRGARLGSPDALRINEWLAVATAPFNTDFVELYNPAPLPVSLGGLFLTDEIIGRKDRHVMPALSFMPGFGYQRLVADGDSSTGADHLDFSLSGDQGEIGLFLPDLTPVDCVYYQAQRLNVSQGRSPNGGTALAFFDTPTPGAPNPLIVVNPQGGALVINEVLANNASALENGRTPDWVELYNGTTNVINLAGCSLTDDTLQPRRFVFPAGAGIAPGAYLRLLCDPGSLISGALVNTNFALKSSGGGVYLFDAPGNGGSLLASVTYGLQAADLSIGRVPDGSGAFRLTLPTPDAANAPVTTLGNIASLKINEWLADPAPGDDDWFEVYNPGTLPVAIGGLHLTDDLNNRTKHVIAPLSYIGFGTNAYQRFVADGNTGAGADHAGFSLRGAGEALGISTAGGALIDGVAFGAQAADISEGRFPDGATNIVRFAGTPSPGESNWRELADVVISEVLTHTDSPLEDAVELRNTTGVPVDISGWWLSDDPGALRKYQIPSPTIVPANGFAVIYESAFTNAELAAVPFALSSHGDEVVLSAFANNALTGYRALVDFGAADNGVSFGRHVTSDGRVEFVALVAHTFGADDPDTVEEFRQGAGATNAAPRVGPVVISEIMYHPPDLGTNDNTRDEYIELHNISTTPVGLVEGTNSWRLRDAVDFDFAPGTVIPAGGYLLVVGFDPANNPAALAGFRGRYNLGGSTPIVGPYSGKLGNDSDDIELRKPGVPDIEGVDSILVERVRYADVAPWPLNADGIGFSLHRESMTAFANDPANWFADAPSPGPSTSTGDTDDDGLPDSWESQFGFDPLNPLDAGLDADGDGLTNLQEFQMGSNPRDASSGISISSITLSVDGTNVVLSFIAFANQTYTVEAATSFGGSWTPVRDIAAEATTRTVQVPVPVNGPMKFFRLRTPWRFATATESRIDSIQTAPGSQVKLAFTVAPNRACVLEQRASLTGGSWTTVTNVPSSAAAQNIEVTVPRPGGSGFFRLRTP